MLNKQTNNACALLSHILNIVKSYWLQHAHDVNGVYEFFAMMLGRGRGVRVF